MIKTHFGVSLNSSLLQASAQANQPPVVLLPAQVLSCAPSCEYSLNLSLSSPGIPAKKREKRCSSLFWATPALTFSTNCYLLSLWLDSFSPYSPLTYSILWVSKSSQCF